MIVYQTRNGNLHCVFADELKQNKSHEYDSVKCINSHADSPYIFVDLNKDDFQIFKVDCIARPYSETSEKVTVDHISALPTPGIVSEAIQIIHPEKKNKKKNWIRKQIDKIPRAQKSFFSNLE